MINEGLKNQIIRQLKAEIGLLRLQLKQAQEFSANLENPYAPPTQSTYTNVPAYNEAQGNENGKTHSEVEAVNKKLRSDLLENIDLIKRMFSVEQNLRARLEEEESRANDKEADNRMLQIENNNLRERVEILESLIMEDRRSAMVCGNQSGTPKEGTSLKYEDTNNTSDTKMLPPIVISNDRREKPLNGINIKTNINGDKDSEVMSTQSEEVSTNNKTFKSTSSRRFKTKRSQSMKGSNDVTANKNITFFGNNTSIFDSFDKITSSSSLLSSSSLDKNPSYLSVAQLRDLLSSGTKMKSGKGAMSKTNENERSPPRRKPLPPATKNTNFGYWSIA
jgi:hypothetical protein